MKDLRTELLEIILRINEETEHAAFFNFSGHVDISSVAVGKDKDEKYNERFYSKGFIYAEEIPEIIEDLQQFLPKENALRQQDEENIHSNSITQEGE